MGLGKGVSTWSSSKVFIARKSRPAVKYPRFRLASGARNKPQVFFFENQLSAMMCEVIPTQMIGVAMAGKAVTKVVHRCHSAKEDRNLNLSECQLMSFPDAVYHLLRNTVLLTCDLSSNVFRKIPPQLPIKFVNITELNLSNNRLSSLPEEIKDMKDLQKLDLSHNDFMMIPKIVFKIPHLVFLNLKKNFIVDVDVSKIRSAPALRELDLEDNPLTKTAHVQLQSLPSSRLLVHVTVPKPEDDDSDDDFDFTPPNSSV